MPYRYFIHLSYHGEAFKGWQIQPNAATVQGFIEDGLSKIQKSKIAVTGCGRTDSGVHARFFVAHFDSNVPLSDTERTVFRLNRFLPPSISIKGIFPVTPGSHARFSALWREYEYTILLKKDPFLTDVSWLLPWKLDLKAMNSGASLLITHSDFECFSKVNTDVSHFRCNIMEAGWYQSVDQLTFRIKADRFLRNMVRAIVGTLVDMGRGKIDYNGLDSIIQSHDRRKAGSSVPARGLILTNVGYDPQLYSIEPMWFSEEFPDKIESQDDNYSQFHDSSGKETDE